MFRQLIFIIVISALTVVFAAELYGALHYLGAAQNNIIKTVASWLPRSKLMLTISKIIAVILLPLLVSYIAAFIYWLFKRDELPKFKQIIWSLWLISALIFIFYK
jgi:hypothetical protein